METTYFSLGSKASFNKALRHFYAVNDAVDEVESKGNVADYINDLLDDEELHPDQILPLVGSVIREKFNYSFKSFSIPSNITEFTKIADETSKWSALDLVVIYFAPDGKRHVINPKNVESWERVRELHRDQLVVIYSKYLKEENKKFELEAIETLFDLIKGKDVSPNKNFIDQSAIVRVETPSAKPAQAKAPAQKPKKINITPKYGVQVTNELFHNGNVEAWKKILESYNAKYPDLTVHVMFGGEVINDINSLFKWGKVKHGDSIFFQVSGENILGVSKLQKYLYEGASPRYEQFLKLGVGRVLNLF
ncbi:MAG TPA: hypothetical protein PLA51_12425 [Spirochaetota bacterium]|nr:hypothetical protein [Spirochaetota bacterium]